MANSIIEAGGVGTLRYNGFDFTAPGCAPPVYQLIGRPVYDGADRTVTHLHYRLELTTLLHGENEGAAAARAAEARERLTRPGRLLELAELGLGDTAAGPGGSHREIAWGPRPGELVLEPLAGALAWQLRWTCEFRVTEPGAAAAGPGWLGYTLESTWEIDDRGFTTRLLRGEVELPRPALEAEREGPLARVRERLALPVPRGFRRTESRWREAADGARLTFEIRDEQLRDGPLPAGLVAAQLRFDLDCEPAANSAGEELPRIARLHGVLETAPGAPRGWAVTRFLAAAADRRARLQQALPAGGVVLPVGLRVEQQLFSNETAFSVEYLVAGGRAELLLRDGLWAPWPEEGEQAWRSWMEPLWAPGGTARVRNVAAPAVIDLVDHPADRAEIRARGTPAAAAARPVSRAAWVLPAVAPETSWLRYQVRLRLAREEELTRHRIAQAVRTGPEGAAAFGPPFHTPAPGFVVERHGAPRQQLVLEGEAQRLQFLPAPPRLTRYGGRPVLETAREETLEPLDRLAGRPRYRLRWRITYAVDGPVSRESLPERP